jgi:hypothetical protein
MTIPSVRTLNSHGRVAPSPKAKKRPIGRSLKEASEVGILGEAMQGTIPLSGTYLEIARRTTEGNFQGFGPLLMEQLHAVHFPKPLPNYLLLEEQRESTC